MALVCSIKRARQERKHTCRLWSAADDRDVNHVWCSLRATLAEQASRYPDCWCAASKTLTDQPKFLFVRVLRVEDSSDVQGALDVAFWSGHRHSGLFKAC